MPAPATAQVRVEFEDVDAFGIVHHSKLVCYLERARLRLLGQLRVPVSDGAVHPVMYELSLRFRRPARLGDELVVTAEVACATDYQVGLKFLIRKDGELLVRATSKIVFWDSERGEPVAVPIPELDRDLAE